MSSVDERIVEMRFDNQQFESGVKTSLNTLDKLKLGLNGLDKSASSLSNLQASADRFNISGIANGVDRITERFSILGIMGDQVIRRLTNGLINLGMQSTQIVKNLSFAPIKTGFAQYEQETKSVQTLMNATGLTMEEVEKYTEKLGFYVDETSYSYESMFKTVAGMMSSGVENVDTAMAAVVGLGNAAGLAGVDAAQATHAFEGFGKAIAQNKMDSRTWSWIKTAGMDTAALKQGFIDAGVEAGTLVQETDKAGNTLTYVANKAGKANKALGAIDITNFEDSFRHGWLNRDVMLSAVGKYSTAFEQIYDEYVKSGGTKTADDIIRELGSDLDEYSLKAFKAANQTRTFSDVLEYISGTSARRWSTIYKKIFGNFEESSKLWSDLINPMYSLFIDPLDNIVSMLDEWRELEGYKDITNTLTNSFEGLSKIVRVLRDAFHDIFPELDANRFKSFTSSISELSEAFFNLVKVNEDGEIESINENLVKVLDGFKGFLSLIQIIGKAVKAFFNALEPATNKLKDFGLKLLDTFSKIGKYLINLNDTIDSTNVFSKINDKIIVKIDSLKNKFTNLGNTLKNVGSIVKNFVINKFKDLKNVLSNVFDTLNANRGLTLAGLLGGTFATINFGRFAELFSYPWKLLSNAAEFIDGFLGTIEDAVYSFAKSASADVLIKIAKAIAILAASLLLLASINPDALVRATAAITGLLYGLMASLEVFSGYFGKGKVFDALSSKNILTLSVLTTGLIKVAASLILMAAALKITSSVDPEKMSESLGSIIVMTGVLVGAMILLSKYSGKNVNMAKMGKGIQSAATGLLIMSAALAVMAKFTDANSIGNAIFAVAAMATIFGLLTKFGASGFGGGSKMKAVGSALVSASSALLIMSAALAIMAKFTDADSIGNAVFAIASMATIFGLLNRFGGSGLNMVAMGAGLIEISAALLIVSGALAVLGAMDPGNLGNAIFAVSALAFIFGLFNQFGGSGLNMIAMGAGLIIMSVAIDALTASLVALSAVSSMVGTGLLALSAMLVVIGLAGILIEPALVPLLALSAALLIISASIAIAGSGFALLGTGLATFSASLLAVVVNILGAVDALILGLASIAASLVGAVAIIVGAIAMGIAEGIPTIVRAILLLVKGILSALADNLPAIASSGIRLITELINAISSQIVPLVEAGINLIITFVNALAEAIDTHGVEILSAVDNLLWSILGIVAEAIAQLLALIPGIGPKMADGLREGFAALREIMHPKEILGDVDPEMQSAGESAGESYADGLESTNGEAENAGLELSNSSIIGMTSNLSEFLDVGGESGQGFIDGISDLLVDSKNTGKNFSNESIVGMTSNISEFLNAGSDSGQGFIDGMISKYDDAKSAGYGLGSSALSGARSALDSHSPSKEFAKLGKYSGDGYKIGMESTFKEIYNTSDTMGKVALDAVSNSLKYISDYISSDSDFNPVITPVVDLTNIKAASGQINRYLRTSLPFAVNGASSASRYNEMSIEELINVGYDILRTIENGSSLYFDDGAFAGRINRRLGLKV